jgi:mediator of RNA polymerase II transcription subunit 24
LPQLLPSFKRFQISPYISGIHLKTVLPRGCSGDAYNLSSLILQQALVAAVPNELILSFLRHSLAAQTVSYAALLDAIALFGVDGSVTQSPASSSDGSDTSATPKKIPSRPHCVASLLDLIEASQSCMTSRGKPEECVALASSTLKVTLWLLKTMNFILEVGEKVTEVDSKNFFVALHLVQKYLQSEFSLSLLYIGKAEDKETYDKVVSMSQQVSQVNQDVARYRDNRRNDIHPNYFALFQRETAYI